MHTTSPSLLDQLRRPDQREAWGRFSDLYTPLLYYWARGQNLTESDAADLVQEVFVVLVTKLPEFRYDRDRSFRSWLRTITINKHRELKRRRKPESLDPAHEPAVDDSRDSFEEKEYRTHVVRQMLHILKPQFPPSTWQLFQEHVIDGRDAREIAGARHVTLGTIYAAKSKVLHRLRQELAELLD